MIIKKSNPRSLIFKTRFGIHTFGLSDPIDILILDKNMYVKKMFINLKPNRIFLWNPKYSTVVELPKNTISSSKTETGDQIKFK